jgi:hypothetical protein
MILRSVPARVGLLWVRFGFACLMRRPLQALLLVLVYFGLVAALQLIPLLGIPLSIAVTQVTTLGFMQGARNIARGQPAWPTVFAQLLRVPPRRLRSMLLLCLVYALALMLALGLSSLADGGALLRLFLFSAYPAKGAVANGAMGQAGLITLLVYLPVSMAFWFAPPLVAWWGMGVAQALFTSFVVVGRNLGAFALYVAQWWGLFAATLILGSLAAAALRLDTSSLLLELPLWLLLFAPFALSFQARVHSLLGEPPDARPVSAN